MNKLNYPYLEFIFICELKTQKKIQSCFSFSSKRNPKINVIVVMPYLFEIGLWVWKKIYCNSLGHCVSFLILPWTINTYSRHKCWITSTINYDEENTALQDIFEGHSLCMILRIWYDHVEIKGVNVNFALFLTYVTQYKQYKCDFNCYTFWSHYAAMQFRNVIWGSNAFMTVTFLPFFMNGR